MLKLKVAWLLVLLGVPLPTNDTLDTLDIMTDAVYTERYCEYEGLSRIMGIQIVVPDTNNIKCLEAIARIEEYSNEQTAPPRGRE